MTEIQLSDGIWYSLPDIAVAELQRLKMLQQTVSQMREAQKRYFQTRQQSDLHESKKLEKQVDNKLAECDKPILKQAKLL